ncbi:globin domain-containing protein [Streptacidiphilus sp. EB129]|uniref:globin domain-containing protein n=1 Tax=Streptacidiphilus sp. EB129 TaxID=3156262 RepID=UPI003518DA03
MPGPQDPAPPASAPSAPAPPAPVPMLPLAAPHPPYVPMITDAPGLNWAGPGDAWSRAWAVPRAPLPPEPRAPGAPGLPPLLLPNTAVAVVPLAARASAAPADPAAGPTSQDIALVRRSLGVLESVADRATAHFYAVLFLNHPELRGLFPAAMDVQRDRLFRALLAAGNAADDPPALSAYLDRLARGHRKYGVLDEHYGPVGEALLAALERYCGRYWDQATELAWRRIYRVISEAMMAASALDATRAPAWWQAEVLSVERRSGDVAVLRLRTDQHYPYRAGQYTTLEVPMWPRVWRPYSLASAPAPSGANQPSVLELQVRAVPAGWVSNALVHRTEPGDVLRLGPAGGTMVLDHSSDTPLLCLGGGTGIAPIKALVEEVAAHGRARTVEVFYGARREDDLYARAELQELAARHPWLAVRTVVSEGRTDGLSGTLPAVVSRYGPWDEYEAQVSGPPAMIRRAAAVLAGAGVRPEWIHHDLPEEALPH